MPELRVASKRIKQTLQESRKLFNQLSDKSHIASESGTSILFGMLGGFTGTGIAYAMPFYTAATFAGLAPILAGAGIVIGVLVFRGSDRIKLESKIEVFKRERESILEEIRLLDKDQNVPREVIDEAWKKYRKLLSSSPLFAESEALPLRQKPAEPTNELHLPPSRNDSPPPAR